MALIFIGEQKRRAFAVLYSAAGLQMQIVIISYSIKNAFRLS